MAIAGHRVLVSYEGQPSTCYACGDAGHLHQACPNRRRDETMTGEQNGSTWSHIVSKGARSRGGGEDGQTDMIRPAASGEGTPDQQPEESDQMRPPPQDQRGRANAENHPRRGEQTLIRHGEVRTNAKEVPASPQMTTDGGETGESAGTAQQQRPGQQAPLPQDEGQGERMDTENDPEQGHRKSDSAETSEANSCPTDSATTETAGATINATSRIKKIKLETGKTQQRERKRSRSRTTTQRQEKL